MQLDEAYSTLPKLGSAHRRAELPQRAGSGDWLDTWECPDATRLIRAITCKHEAEHVGSKRVCPTGDSYEAVRNARQLLGLVGYRGAGEDSRDTSDNGAGVELAVEIGPEAAAIHGTGKRHALVDT
jgi:hypothetical protein